MPLIRPPHAVRLLATAGCAALLSLGLVGSATATTRSVASEPHHWRVRVGAQSDDRAIQTMGFYPRHLWVDQGDTVTWVARAAEIHTVTFLATGSPCQATELCELPRGFDPGDMRQSTPQGGPAYDGSSYYNSGVVTNATGDTGPLPPFVQVQRRYRLTFPKSLAPGTYTYYCVVHGSMMRGKIIVQAAGSPYPFTQRQYNRRSVRKAHRDIRDGYQLWAAARHQAAKLSRPHRPAVLVGAMDKRAMVMRFVHRRTTIRPGDRVRFFATSMGEPHTVTFGDDLTGCGAPPCSPEMPWNVRLDKAGNERATYPGRNGGYSGDPRNLNTGLMLGAPPKVTHLPSALTVTFPRAGRFHYTCALHDYLGMVGNVVVRRRTG